MEDQTKTSSSTKGWFIKYGGLILRIIGIIADITAIIGLFSINPAGKFEFNPFFGLGIWFIGLITYFSILDWIRVEKYQSPSTSIGFIIDVTFKYKYPILFIPIGVLFVLFIWAMVEITIFTEGMIWGAMFSILILLGIFIAFIMDVQRDKVDAFLYKKNTQKTKEIIDSQWNKLDKIIQTRLKDQYYLTVEDLHDQQLLLDFTTKQLSLILATYASKHPQISGYGTVYHKDEDFDEVYSEEKVLVNLKVFPNEHYHF